MGETYYGMQESPMWFSTAAPETIAAFYRKRCAAYGVTPATPEMIECIQREIQQTKMKHALKDAAQPKRVYNHPKPVYTAPSRSIQTSCINTGTHVFCSSY